MKLPSSFFKLMLSAGLSAAALSTPALAAPKTWNNGDGNFLWDTSSVNWTGSTWVNSDSATFGTTGAGTLSVASGISANGITINAGATGYVFTGSTLTNTGTTTINESAQFDNSVSFGQMAVGADKTATFTGGGTLGGLRGGGGTGGTYSFTAGAYTFSSGFVNDIGGTIVNMNFTGASTFTLPGNSALGYAGTANLDYNSSATSSFAGFLQLGRAGNGSVTQHQGTINASGQILLASNGASGTLDIQGGTFNAGTQQIVLNNAKTSGTGLVKVNGAGATLTVGTLSLNSEAGGTSDLQVLAGTLNVNTIGQAGAGTKSITLNGGTLGTNTVTTATWAPNMTLGGDVAIRAANASGTSANITLSEILSGTGGLTKTGAGMLTLSGANTYTGDTVVSTGTFLLSSTGTMTFDIMTGLNNSNSVSGVGIAQFDGTFVFNLADEFATSGSWVIADVDTQTFGGTFGILTGATSWSVAGDTYTFNNYTFDTTTGVLTAVPEPSSYALVGVMLLGVAALRGKRRKLAGNRAS